MATRIRSMSRSEFHQLMLWAAAEGWNPGLNDEEIFWQTDPEAFIAIEEGGRMVGGGSIVCYGGRYGFMGLFIVDPARRGAGLGRALWFERRDRLRARLEPGAPIEMDGVFAMAHFYAAGGFVVQHRDLRFERAAGASSSPSPRHSDSMRVAELSSVPFERVAELDARCFPAPRAGFLRAWIAPQDGVAVGVMRGPDLVGYAVRRRCTRGHRVGPLFARESAAAEVLLDHLLQGVPGELVQVDVPERNSAAMDMVRRRGMTEVFGCVRMTIGRPPAVAWDEVYGVTTLELG
jgi:GNAT superfamily N-acetyltransferase